VRTEASLVIEEEIMNPHTARVEADGRSQEKAPQKALTPAPPTSGPVFRDLEKAREAVEFPSISFEEFKRYPTTLRTQLLARNRIINTDTYNRTMCELTGRLFTSSQGRTPEAVERGQALHRKGGPMATFALQMRRSPFNYLVVAGVEDLVEELTMLPISRAELDFAKAWYRETNVPFFNEEMWTHVVDERQGRLPFDISAVRDGTILFPGEPVLTVRGPEEMVAHFEHVFHRLFYPTLVATRARELLTILGDSSRFIEVGKRAAITEPQHYQALKAMAIGGGFAATSNDAGFGLFGMKDVGTIGHRYVQRFPNEESAFRHAIENLPGVTLLVDLHNTIEGIDLAVRLKEEYRDTRKPIGVRLDSGDIKEQTRYFLRETNARHMTDPRLDFVVVEGIDTLEELKEIERMVKDEFTEEDRARVLYGAGGLLVSDQTGRKDASTGFKLSRYTDDAFEEQPTLKNSDSPGKRSDPGTPRLMLVDSQRVLAQEGEEFNGEVLNLFHSLVVDGASHYGNGGVEEAQKLRKRHESLLNLNDLNGTERQALRALPSKGTKALIEQVQTKYRQRSRA
jgi:putative nicotinate phosphoribosyltransferase